MVGEAVGSEVVGDTVGAAVGSEVVGEVVRHVNVCVAAEPLNAVSENTDVHALLTTSTV